jgi:hypothetical protein
MSSKSKITCRISPAAIIMAVILATSIAASSIQAQPSDEIRRAVAASGAPSVSQAAPDAFLHAFSSVLVRSRGRDVPAYVSAAVSMRPDLAPQITVAALRAHRSGGKEITEKQVSCDWVDPIIRAAIAAAPSAANAIVQAAIAAEPYARECILAAAGMSKDLRVAYTKRSDGKEVISGKELVGKEEVAPCPPSAYLRPPGIDVGNVNSSIVGTINPANLGQGGIVSPEHH